MMGMVIMTKVFLPCAPLPRTVVHSNKMIEGMTQLMLKGYEESRVALTCLLFSLPSCAILGAGYAHGNGVVQTDILKIDFRDYQVWGGWGK